ncbi:MAG: HAMP domain-containing histidine kinase [Aphanocapsa lilacina HA4352-LM1]|jgi:signal transduction histidine kinase|nr:HAMP domain-containing histidine kinase [Aphanocapsa lilacina HA4352-LM1]
MKVSLSPVLAASQAAAGSTPPSSQLHSLCQLQAEHLAMAHTLVCVLIAYYDPHTGAQRRVTHTAQGPQGLPREALAAIAGEEWSTGSLPVATVSEIEIANLPGRAYLCPLVQREPHPEFQLFVSGQPLDTARKQALEQAAALFTRHLELYQRCTRQQSEIQLLEQVVQRTGHQLRNPLALIGLYAENLCLGLEEGSTREQAQIIRETVKELNANLTELVYCGQGARLRMGFQDLRALMAQSVEAIGPWLERKCLRVRYPDSSLLFACDRLQMKQVFDNLLSNALHFSPEGGTITCHWRSFQNEVLIEIADQGPGLSAQDLQHVFTPFYSRRPGGTGLGLAIAKKIVLDHQGSLWVQNLPTGGAQFSLGLPRGIH